MVDPWSGGARCPDEFICPITQEIMRDPVLISETGQVFL